MTSTPAPEAFPDPAHERRLARFEGRPPAPESFHHLTTCRGTPDAPDLCCCPPSVVDVQGTTRPEAGA